MASIKKGQLRASRIAWRHLRWAKRVFWKMERRAAKNAAKREAQPQLRR